MFIVFLKFGERRAEAGRFMEGHKAWIASGFEDGVFLMAGSIQPNAGGVVLAHNTTRAALEERVLRDPFVVQRIVQAEPVEVTPSRMDERLQFLRGGS
jgi:uncharacterized protein YciI